MNPEGQQVYDAVIIGGGVAGLTAARDFADHGRSAVVLEARDRLGGRVWTRNFADTDAEVELGGQWIEPERQVNVRREVERYGLPTEHSPEPKSFPTLLDGDFNPGPLPIPFEEITDLERAIFHGQKAASRIEPGLPLDQQRLDDLDVSWKEFFAPLELPPATLDFLGAFTGLYAARYPGRLLRALPAQHSAEPRSERLPSLGCDRRPLHRRDSIPDRRARGRLRRDPARDAGQERKDPGRPCSRHHRCGRSAEGQYRRRGRAAQLLERHQLRPAVERGQASGIGIEAPVSASSLPFPQVGV